MVRFTTILLKFDEKGEKTGWTYIDIPFDIAEKIKPGHRQTYRVKGKLDNYEIKQVAILPMGDGGFIMPVNADMRKGIGKRKGAIVNVQLEEDTSPVKPPADLIECLADEPGALNFYNHLTKGHQNYFTKWIESAKTESTKTKRIAQTINGLSKHQDFGEMLRAWKKDRKELK
jgi:hypothetical protein